MDYKGISPSELADSIGVQRSNVSHVLNGRNKPSFQFIEKMLQIYPELNAKWLLLGTGNMVDTVAKTRTLFDQITEPPKVSTPKFENPDKEPVKNTSESNPEHEVITPLKNEKKIAENEVQDQIFSSEKPIERLLVFFNDQTFKVYYPSK